MGLLCSEKMLEADTKKFLEFFNKIKKETNEAAQLLEDVKRERGDAQSELKHINEECSAVQSKINKNLEILEKQIGLKDFFDELAPTSGLKEFMEDECENQEPNLVL